MNTPWADFVDFGSLDIQFWKTYNRLPFRFLQGDWLSVQKNIWFICYQTHCMATPVPFQETYATVCTLPNKSIESSGRDLSRTGWNENQNSRYLVYLTACWHRKNTRNASLHTFFTTCGTTRRICLAFLAENPEICFSDFWSRVKGWTEKSWCS